MNHSHGLNVTRGYVKLDFSPAWRLNAKVIDFVFFSDKPSKQVIAKDIEDAEDKFFRLSPKSYPQICLLDAHRNSSGQSLCIADAS